MKSVHESYERKQQQHREIPHGPAKKSSYERKQSQHQQVLHGPGRKPTKQQGGYK
jgi:hypothetical protein